MSDIESSQLRFLEDRLKDIAHQLTRVQYASPQPGAWQPAVNVYRCQSGIVIAAELAGIDRSQIELRVEPRRVWVRGHRLQPEPPPSAGPPLQVLAMEIDHGAFERQIVLPADVALDQVLLEQREGLLWIFLRLVEEP